jgi:hypothetical protein
MAGSVSLACVSLLALALASAGCHVRKPEPRPALGPLEVIHHNCIDLPDAPFVARTIGPKAILLNRTKSSFIQVQVGCVRQEGATARVVESLFMQLISDGAWRPGDHVEDLLRDVNSIDYYIANQKKSTGSDHILKPCPDDGLRWFARCPLTAEHGRRTAQLGRDE